MKMKRLLAWLLALVMCFILTACGPGTSDESVPPTEIHEQETETPTVSQSSTVTPLLYRVTDDSGNTIWLFGSIHVGRENYYPLPDYVLDAFESAEALAVEADIVAFEKDLGLQMTALSHLVYRDGSTINDHISPELYEKAVEIFKEYNSYVPALDMYCPALWGSMIDSLMLADLGGDPNYGIDKHLIDAAYDTEKEIIEIESAEFQYKLLANFEEDIQLMILESAVESYESKEEASAELAELMDLWASGDETAFAEYLNAYDDTMTESEMQTIEKYNQAMITDRNLTMTAYAEEAISSGKEIFICVGAAHILGDGALADLLSERGYSVVRITE